MSEIKSTIFQLEPEMMVWAERFSALTTDTALKQQELAEEFRRKNKKLSETYARKGTRYWKIMAASVGLTPDSFHDPNIIFDHRYIEQGFAAFQKIEEISDEPDAVTPQQKVH